MRRPSRSVPIPVSIGAAVGLALTGVTALPAAAAPPSVQALIDAAPAGSTVHLPAGAFAGGITIDKSLTLAGAGQDRTVLRGGDSVVSVLNGPDGSRPTVTIADLQLTGGLAHDKAGGDDFRAFGGGLYVGGVPGEDVGPTVTLDRVLVAGNRVTSLHTVPSGEDFPCPGGVECPFALSAGAGIASLGDLTVEHSIVRDNLGGGHVSDVEGGGIWSGSGRLTIDSTTISGNRTDPKDIGRFSEGGGVFTEDGTVAITNSSIHDNTSTVTTSWPVHPAPGSSDYIWVAANAAGVHISAGATATIDRTRIERNHVRADDPIGEAQAFDAGLAAFENGTMRLTRSTISGNTTDAVAATSADVGSSGNAVELDGTSTVSDTVICDNTTAMRATDGIAQNSDGLAVFNFGDQPAKATLTRVAITGNTASVRSDTGAAAIIGVGALNDGLLTLTDSIVQGNRGTATGATTTAQGGGIWNGSYLTGPPAVLTLQRSAVTGNSVVAKGGTAQGGGIYTTGGDGISIALDHSVVQRNAPDQVFDASAAPSPLHAQAKAAGSALPARR